MTFAVPSLPGSGKAGKSKNTGTSKSGTGSGSKTTPAVTAATVPREENAPGSSFNLILQQMLGAYEPAQVTYTPQNEQILAGEIASWLRPAYDTAIEQRAGQTATHNAQLDADAIARGMGTSSYVTDVKSRNYQQEADDVRLMESDYGAKLSLYLYNAMDADRARKLEADSFNASESNKARAKAYDAALSLYLQMLQPAKKSSGKGSKSSGGSLINSIMAAGGSVGGGSTSASTGLAYIGSLTAAQQRQLFNGSSTATAATRNEVIRAIGADNFTQLQKQFNSGK
jgi:hypothetical protein